MKVKISYSKDVVKSIEKYKIITYSEIEGLVRKFLLKFYHGQDINIDVKRLRGKYRNLIRIRKGNLKILIKVDVKGFILNIDVLKIDNRGKVYK